MRKQKRSAKKTLSLLPTSNMPSLPKLRKKSNAKDYQKKETIEPDDKTKNRTETPQCQVCKTAFRFTFITVIIVLSENCSLCIGRCLANIYTNSSYI